MKTLPAFRLEPQYRDYVWGGRRLRPGQLTAEMWAVYQGNRIIGGPLDGRTLAEAAAAEGAALVGERVLARASRGGGAAFPVLVKLLDCAEWLSLQVHPNDEQAVELEGPGKNGKTEAWHILEAAPGAEILCGFKPEVDPAAALRSVQDGTILDTAARLPVRAGETLMIHAGTLHALGPGLLLYEVQQTSDITYRVFDWKRPASAERPLHISQSLAVLDVSADAAPMPPQAFTDGFIARLARCPYFALDLLDTWRAPLLLDPGGQTFHALTVIEGSAELRGSGWGLPLTRYQTALVPAGAGAYQVAASERTRLLKAAVE